MSRPGSHPGRTRPLLTRSALGLDRLLTLLAMSPLFLIASSMAFVGRTARRLAERSYASASGGDQLPVSTSVLRASGSAALRARMQADIDKGRIDREEGQVSPSLDTLTLTLTF